MTWFAKDQPFFLVAGPCVLDSPAINLQIAKVLKEIATAYNIPVMFKGSFDKANRSQAQAPRGPGLPMGLDLLEQVKHETGLPVITDIHESEQADAVASVVDAIQIPAFLCRQTDLVLAAARTGLPINIKKGPFAHGFDMKGALAKVRLIRDGDLRTAITERGTFFGYGDLVVDLRVLAGLRRQGIPCIFDGTHSVQQPGRGDNGASGGCAEYTKPLTLAAVAAGASGVFLEVHPNPAESPSDRHTILPLNQLKMLVSNCLIVHGVTEGQR